MKRKKAWNRKISGFFDGTEQRGVSFFDIDFSLENILLFYWKTAL